MQSYDRRLRGNRCHLDFWKRSFSILTSLSAYRVRESTVWQLLCVVICLCVVQSLSQSASAIFPKSLKKKLKTLPFKINRSVWLFSAGVLRYFHGTESVHSQSSLQPAGTRLLTWNSFLRIHLLTMTVTHLFCSLCSYVWCGTITPAGVFFFLMSFLCLLLTDLTFIFFTCRALLWRWLVLLSQYMVVGCFFNTCGACWCFAPIASWICFVWLVPP